MNKILVAFLIGILIGMIYQLGQCRVNQNRTSYKDAYTCENQ